MDSKKGKELNQSTTSARSPKGNGQYSSGIVHCINSDQKEQTTFVNSEKPLNNSVNTITKLTNVISSITQNNENAQHIPAYSESSPNSISRNFLAAKQAELDEVDNDDSDQDSSSEGRLYIDEGDDKIDDDADVEKTKGKTCDKDMFLKIKKDDSISKNSRKKNSHSIASITDTNKESCKKKPPDSFSKELHETPVQPSKSPDSTTYIGDNISAKRIAKPKASFLLIENTFVCLYCLKKFLDIFLFRQHVWWHLHQSGSQSPLCLECNSLTDLYSCPAVAMVFNLLVTSCSQTPLQKKSPIGSKHTLSNNSQNCSQEKTITDSQSEFPTSNCNSSTEEAQRSNHPLQTSQSKQVSPSLPLVASVGNTVSTCYNSSSQNGNFGTPPLPSYNERPLNLSIRPTSVGGTCLNSAKVPTPPKISKAPFTSGYSQKHNQENVVQDTNTVNSINGQPLVEVTTNINTKSSPSRNCLENSELTFFSYEGKYSCYSCKEDYPSTTSFYHHMLGHFHFRLRLCSPCKQQCSRIGFTHKEMSERTCCLMAYLIHCLSPENGYTRKSAKVCWRSEKNRKATFIVFLTFRGQDKSPSLTQLVPMNMVSSLLKGGESGFLIRKISETYLSAIPPPALAPGKEMQLGTTCNSINSPTICSSLLISSQLQVNDGDKLLSLQKPNKKMSGCLTIFFLVCQYKCMNCNKELSTRDLLHSHLFWHFHSLNHLCTQDSCSNVELCPILKNIVPCIPEQEDYSKIQVVVISWAKTPERKINFSVHFLYRYYNSKSNSYSQLTLDDVRFFFGNDNCIFLTGYEKDDGTKHKTIDKNQSLKPVSESSTFKEDVNPKSTQCVMNPLIDAGATNQENLAPSKTPSPKEKIVHTDIIDLSDSNDFDEEEQQSKKFTHDGFRKMTFFCRFALYICQDCSKRYVQLDLFKSHIMWHFHSQEKLCTSSHYYGHSDVKECPILVNIMSCLPNTESNNTELNKTVEIHWRKDSLDKTLFKVKIYNSNTVCQTLDTETHIDHTVKDSDSEKSHRKRLKLKQTAATAQQEEAGSVQSNSVLTSPSERQTQANTKAFSINSSASLDIASPMLAVKAITERIPSKEENVQMPPVTPTTSIPNIVQITSKLLPTAVELRKNLNIDTNTPVCPLKSTVPSPTADHSKGGFYVCGKTGCGFSTLTSNKFSEHLTQLHSDVESYHCVHCGLTSETIEKLLKHMDSHLNSKIFILYQCCVRHCEYTTNLFKEFSSHLHIYHSDKTVLFCRYCKKRCPDIKSLLKHLESSLLKFIQCPHCTARDTNRSRMLHHILLEHPGKPRQIIVTCQRICLEKFQNGIPPPILKIERLKENIAYGNDNSHEVIDLDDISSDSDNAYEHTGPTIDGPVLEEKETASKSSEKVEEVQQEGRKGEELGEGLVNGFTHDGKEPSSLTEDCDEKTQDCGETVMKQMDEGCSDLKNNSSRKIENDSKQQKHENGRELKIVLKRIDNSIIVKSNTSQVPEKNSESSLSPKFDNPAYKERNVFQLFDNGENSSKNNLSPQVENSSNGSCVSNVADEGTNDSVNDKAAGEMDNVVRDENTDKTPAEEIALYNIGLGGQKLNGQLKKCYIKEQGKHKCQLCSVVYNTMYKIHLHLLSDHFRWHLWRCMDCSSGFYSLTKVRSHCWRKHRCKEPDIKSLPLPQIEIDSDGNPYMKNDERSFPKSPSVETLTKSPTPDMTKEMAAVEFPIENNTPNEPVKKRRRSNKSEKIGRPKKNQDLPDQSVALITLSKSLTSDLTKEMAAVEFPIENNTPNEPVKKRRRSNKSEKIGRPKKNQDLPDQSVALITLSKSLTSDLTKEMAAVEFSIQTETANEPVIIQELSTESVTVENVGQPKNNQDMPDRSATLITLPKSPTPDLTKEMAAVEFLIQNDPVNEQVKSLGKSTESVTVENVGEPKNNEDVPDQSATFITLVKLPTPDLKKSTKSRKVGRPKKNRNIPDQSTTLITLPKSPTRDLTKEMVAFEFSNENETLNEPVKKRKKSKSGKVGRPKKIKDVCDIPAKSFSNLPVRKKKRNGFTKKKKKICKMQCTFCRYSCLKRMEWIRHMLLDHPKKYRHLITDIDFDLIDEHIERQENGQFPCPFCNLLCKLRADCKIHICRAHMGLGYLYCDHCDFVTFLPFCLEEHIETEHLTTLKKDSSNIKSVSNSSEVADSAISKSGTDSRKTHSGSATCNDSLEIGKDQMALQKNTKKKGRGCKRKVDVHSEVSKLKTKSLDQNKERTQKKRSCTMRTATRSTRATCTITNNDSNMNRTDCSNDLSLDSSATTNSSSVTEGFHNESFYSSRATSNTTITITTTNCSSSNRAESNNILPLDSNASNNPSTATEDFYNFYAIQPMNVR